jgi:MFS family permease
MAVTTGATATGARPGFASGLVNRQLDRYPEVGPRTAYLGITVLATVALYYELYVAGSVSTLILEKLNISFGFFVVALAFGNLIGAFGSLLAGLTDRFGRTNLVVAGLLLSGVMTAFVIPATTSKWPFTIATFVVGLIEGICLVATPALIRDFSPQTGRATAMGFWTSGPVLGSLAVAVVASHTIGVSPTPSFWTHEYHIAGIAGLVVFLVAALFLRELSPGLRDQLMVSMKDRALVEARAKGIDIEASLRNPFRQLLKADVIVSALGVSVYLLVYYTAVGFGLIYFTTVFGFSVKDGNGLGNWNWGFNVVAVIAVGVISDRLRVRKPLMVIGGVASAILLVVYLERAGHPTSYYHLAILLAALAFSTGVAYTPWMASFTETVEARNPALTATGLAIWGWIIRVVIFVAYLILPQVINTVNPLVDYGAQVKAYATQYPAFGFAGTHPALVSFAEKNAATLTFATKNPALVAFATQNAATLTFAATHPQQVATATKLAPELAVIDANPALFLQLASAPTPALEAQAVAALGGGAQGAAELSTIAANQTAIEGLQQYSTQLTALGKLEATQPALLAQAAQDGPQLTALAHLEATQPALLGQAAQNGAQLTALAKVPAPVDAFMAAHATAVQSAAGKTAGQWKDWYWICFGGMIFFLGCIPLLKGRWSPSKAKADEDAHEALVQAELAKLKA